jgi:glycosyltransferase involved in cell wall biosynthesis
MKALLVSNLYPSRREPTRGIFNLNRFRALARHCEARVVAPVRWWSRLKRPGEWLSVPRETESGLEASYPTYWPLPRLPQSHVPTLHRALRAHLRRLRKEFPFDVILVAMAYPEGVAVARAARELGCPLVTMVLGSDVNELAARPALRDEIRWGLQRSGRVVAVSRALRDRVLELGVTPERVRVQHNGVDGERFTLRDRQEARTRLNLPPDRRLILYVGNLSEEKGVEVLLEGMAALRRSGGPEANLALVGGGPLDDRLRARKQALGLGETVRFLGRRPHGEIPDWMAASDALCLPSFREGCPNVVLEALASGRPVVASAVGGVPELLDRRNGALAPPGDPEALAGGLREVLAREWSPPALRDTVQFLSWDAYGLTLRDALVDALAEGPRPAQEPAVARAAALLNSR